MATPVDYVRSSREALESLTLDLLRHDTANPPGSTRTLVGFIESFLDELGLDCRRVAVDPAKPNLVTTLPGSGDERLLMNGHLDTVPFDGDAWAHDPLGERVDDRIYGRGATDMKGAIAAMLQAIRGFVETETTPPVDLVLALVSDEETGGEAGLPALIDEGIDADACVIGETTCERDRHSVTVADRGSIWLTMEAEGSGAHGSRPMLGSNAIDRLYEGITELRDRFGRRPLDIEASVAPIVEESIDYYEPILGREATRALFEYPTINLGTIQGGTAINAVPEQASAEIDIRLSPGVHTPTVIEEIRGCADRCEGVSITELSWSIGTFESINGPLVEAVAETAEGVVDERIYRRSATGGGDAKTFRNAGIPTVEFGLGTDTVHAVNEYTTIQALQANAEVYASLPQAFADRN